MRFKLSAIAFLALLAACSPNPKDEMSEDALISLIVLDPGHFHASLVQKQMYEGVDKTVHVYAPEGPELNDYISRIESYNEREDSPTSWKLEVYAGEDFLDKLLKEKAGNLVVLAGNNQRKTEYIDACVKAGLNVYSDKPMAIDPADYELLVSIFREAEEKGVLVYDIMTERFEITNILQKTIANREEIFGELLNGTPEDPAIVKKSVHHFSKEVSGIPLKRPAWFFDVKQEGKAIADVGTHLVDLILPGAGNVQQSFSKEDVEIIQSTTRVTPLSPEQFARVTGEERYPSYLSAYVEGDTLKVPANSSLDFRVGNIYAHVTVDWAYKAPEGGADTHYSIMRGSRADIEIRQGAEENYRPELFVIAKEERNEELGTALQAFIQEELGEIYPGLSMDKVDDNAWHILIPDEHRVWHEAHFAEVTRMFLAYFKLGRLPEWEIRQMLTKYFITTSAAGN